MAPPIAAAEALSAELNPHGRELASRLFSIIRDAATPMTADRWALIEKVLTYAADAEQRLAEQTERIAYLESLSMTDELTGLANRRGFEQALERTLAAARRYDETGAVGFFDLDHFKRTNDTLGHEAGDLALRHVAMLLTRNVRRTDLVARLGGDEFLVLLVRTNLVNGTRRIHTLQQILADRPLVYRNRRISVRTSVGIAGYDGESDAAELIRRADRAMYNDKRRAKLTLLPAG